MNNSEKDLETIKNKKSILTVRRVIHLKLKWLSCQMAKILWICRWRTRTKRYNYIPRKSQSLWATTKFKERDKAYQGEDLITTPIKKQRNRELTSEQNRKIKHFRFAEFLSNIELGQSKCFELSKTDFG